jgi:hypothetical protein
VQKFFKRTLETTRTSDVLVLKFLDSKLSCVNLADNYVIYVDVGDSNINRGEINTVN